MQRLNEREARRNLRAWQSLAIPSLDQVAKVPPEFSRTANALEAFAVLARQPAVALCYFPLQLSPHGAQYVDQLTLTDYPAANFLRDTANAEPAFIKGAAPHVRAKVVYTAQSLAPHALSVLEASLPAKPSRAAFMRDYKDLLSPLLDAFNQHAAIGNFQSARLMASEPWYPPPETMRPHIDLGANTRMHLVFKGNQTVVVAGSLARGYPQLRDADAEDYFPRLAELNRDCLFLVPDGYGAVWRGGQNGLSSGVLLPHLEQYQTNGLRLTSRVCFGFS